MKAREKLQRLNHTYIGRIYIPNIDDNFRPFLLPCVKPSFLLEYRDQRARHHCASAHGRIPELEVLHSELKSSQCSKEAGGDEVGCVVQQ